MEYNFQDFILENATKSFININKNITDIKNIRSFDEYSGYFNETIYEVFKVKMELINVFKKLKICYLIKEKELYFCRTCFGQMLYLDQEVIEINKQINIFINNFNDKKYFNDKIPTDFFIYLKDMILYEKKLYLEMKGRSNKNRRFMK